MKIEKIEGVVINERDYSESSKILDVFTKKYGLISVIAKGAKRLKSNLRATASKITYGYFHIYYKEGKLSTLIDIDIIDSLRNIKTDLFKMGYVSFICELVGQVSKQTIKQTDNEEIYNIFIASLIKINNNFDPMVITNIIELKLLFYLGVLPVIDECVKCGNVTSIVTLSAYEGGLLCSKCKINEYIVDPKTIKFIRMLYYVDINKISKLDISDKVKKEIDVFINDYYNYHTGLYLKSKKFLNDIKYKFN